jgi:exodeoxyribonuclease VIII
MKLKIESNETYHSNRRYISSSALKTINKRSVYHLLNQKPFSSSSMSLGTLIHTAILEPENFDRDYFVMPKVDRRTKAGKEKYAEHLEIANGKELVDEDTIAVKDEIMKNFESNEQAVYYNEGVKEVSVYSEIDGVLVKVRPDCYNKELGFISDPKTCQDNSPKGFMRDVYKYGYHLQAVFYSDVLGVDPKNFVFTAIETNHPYSVQCYTLGDEHIERGREAYESALDKWKHYLDSGEVLAYEGLVTNESGVIIL